MILPISTELNGLVCLFIAIDVEGKPSLGNALQDVKILSLRDPVSETCNLVINHIIILIFDALTTELKWLLGRKRGDRHLAISLNAGEEKESKSSIFF